MKPFDARQGAARRSRRWIAGLMLSTAAFAGYTSDFYRLTIIAESPTTFGTEWRIVGGGVGINDAGVVTWPAQRTVNGVLERGIFTGRVTPTGSIQTLIVSGSGVMSPSINNLGQVAFSTSIPNPQLPGGTTAATRYWDPSGSLFDLCINGQQPTPLICFSESLADNTRAAIRIPSSGAFGVVAPVNQVISGAVLQEVNFAEFPPVISRNGLNSAWSGGAGGVTNRIVMNGAIICGRVDLVFPSPSLYRLSGLSINNLGNTAFNVGSNSAIENRLVGVVSTRTGVPSVVRVADTSTGQFTNFTESPAINNLNEVAFAAVSAGSTGAYPFVGDVSGTRAPTPVVVPNETVDGATIGAVFASGLFPHGINDKGQIAFLTILNRPGTGPGTGQRFAIVLADPLPGVSPGNPILPAAGGTLPSGWRFALNCNPAALCRGTATAPRPRRFIDPPLAVGYTYTVEGGPNVASVYIPAPLPNGDATFQVEFNNQVAPLRAGEEFDFTAVVPGGVSTFRITGIDTSEALDPTNPTLFVTGLTFASDASADYSVTMVPIVVDPDDLDRDGVPNTADLCPNTAPGAPVDANGCSADQRDSDGDGVVDSRDQCPATPLGSPVDANGCSALQLDADGDGVPNSVDACPGTASGATVDSRGCSAAQRDTDGDGVNDSIDLCPNTPAGAAVNASGCATSQLDSDGDGVTDNLDACPGTPSGTVVDSRGCPLPPPPSKTCDVNGDNFIDYRDIALILIALGQPANGASDPRDANRNSRIDLYDAALCTKQCDRKLCLPAR
jgi:hypothetical protein